MQFDDKYFLDDDDDDEGIDDACVKRFATPKDDIYISLNEPVAGIDTDITIYVPL